MQKFFRFKQFYSPHIYSSAHHYFSISYEKFTKKYFSSFKQEFRLLISPNSICAIKQIGHSDILIVTLGANSAI